MTIRLTSKRQATFPRSVCEEMHLKPGDKLTLDARVVDGERVWVIQPDREEEPSWFGCLQRYARGKAHDMKSIRMSIAEARKRGKL